MLHYYMLHILYYFCTLLSCLGLNYLYIESCCDMFSFCYVILFWFVLIFYCVVLDYTVRYFTVCVMLLSLFLVIYVAIYSF